MCWSELKRPSWRRSRAARARGWVVVAWLAVRERQRGTSLPSPSPGSEPATRPSRGSAARRWRALRRGSGGAEGAAAFEAEPRGGARTSNGRSAFWGGGTSGGRWDSPVDFSGARRAGEYCGAGRERGGRGGAGTPVRAGGFGAAEDLCGTAGALGRRWSFWSERRRVAGAGGRLGFGFSFGLQGSVGGRGAPRGAACWLRLPRCSWRGARCFTGVGCRTKSPAPNLRAG